MVTARVPLILGLCLCAAVSSATQERADLDFLWRTRALQHPQATVSTSPRRDASAVGLVATGLIRIYQRFISSQDVPACNFEPTCSRFGTQAIHHRGFLHGILLTADRLIRCNGCMMQSHYDFDSATGRFSDPLPNGGADMQR